MTSFELHCDVFSSFYHFLPVFARGNSSDPGSFEMIFIFLTFPRFLNGYIIVMELIDACWPLNIHKVGM